MKPSHEPVRTFPVNEVRSAIRSGMKRAKKHGKSKKKAVIYAMATMAATVGVLLGSSYVSPAVAHTLSQIPIVGSVFEDSDVLRLQKAQENGMVTSIGETQTVNGISVTLEEILYDQNNITVGFVIESEEELMPQYFGAGPDVLIDQKQPSVSSGSYGETILSENKRTAIGEIAVTEEMPDSFELGLLLDGENGETWYFSSPVEKLKDIRTISVDHLQNVEDVTLQVKEMELSKTGMSFTFTSFETQDDFDAAHGGFIEFKVVDQEGQEINGYYGGVTGERIKDGIQFTSRKQFDPIGDDVTALTVTPYLVIPTDGGSVEVGEKGNQVEIEFEGSKVRPIEFKPFKVKISD